MAERLLPVEEQLCGNVRGVLFLRKGDEFSQNPRGIAQVVTEAAPDGEEHPKVRLTESKIDDQLLALFASIRVEDAESR